MVVKFVTHGRCLVFCGKVAVGLGDRCAVSTGPTQHYGLGLSQERRVSVKLLLLLSQTLLFRLTCRKKIKIFIPHPLVFFMVVLC